MCLHVMCADDKHLVYLTHYVKGRNQYINAVYSPVSWLSPQRRSLSGKGLLFCERLGGGGGGGEGRREDGRGASFLTVILFHDFSLSGVDR